MRAERPKQAWEFMWEKREGEVELTAEYSLMAELLPGPLCAAFEGVIRMSTEFSHFHPWLTSHLPLAVIW